MASGSAHIGKVGHDFLEASLARTECESADWCNLLATLFGVLRQCKAGAKNTVLEEPFLTCKVTYPGRPPELLLQDGKL